MNRSAVIIIIAAITIGLFWILGSYIYNPLGSSNTEKNYLSSNSYQNDNNHLRYHSNSGSINNDQVNKLNNHHEQNTLQNQPQTPLAIQHNQQLQQHQQLQNQQNQQQLNQQQQHNQQQLPQSIHHNQIKQQQQVNQQNQQQVNQQIQQQLIQQQQQQINNNNNNNNGGEIPQFLQIYVECNHKFVPPLTSIPSYRIQCLTPKESYECGESRLYLDFIINTYDNPLAETYIFMHGHSQSWHYINPLTHTMEKLIKTNYITEQNFGGYQCYWNYAPTVVLNNLSMELFNFLFKNTNVKLDNNDSWSYPCCGTFFVHTSQIKQRPKSEYIQMVKNLREWSNNYELKKMIGDGPDGYCSRIYEMMWHRILSNSVNVTIPPYCQSEEVMKVNPVLTLSQYKSWKKNVL